MLSLNILDLVSGSHVIIYFKVVIYRFYVSSEFIEALVAGNTELADAVRNLMKPENFRHLLNTIREGHNSLLYG